MLRKNCQYNTVDQLHYHITTQWDHGPTAMSSSLAITLQQLKKDKIKEKSFPVPDSKQHNWQLSNFKGLGKRTVIFQDVCRQCWVLAVCKAHAIYERDKYS